MSPRKAPSDQSDVLSWDEIVKRYEGQWVLIEVTKSEGGWPSEGIVLAHAQKRSGVSKAVVKLDRAPKPGAKYHALEAVHYLRTGEEVRRHLEELGQREVPDWALRFR